MLSLVEGQSVLGVGGRYRFLSRLASGTFAVILKAVDTSSGRIVAIKCTHEPALNAIGEREAALLQELGRRDASGHVAIVRLLDSFVQQRHFCLVLELLGDAIVQLAHGGLLPWRQARPPPFLLNDRTGEPQHKLLALVYRRRQEQEVQIDDDDDVEENEEEAPQRTALDLDDIRQMTVDLCAALVFLHDQGLIHADLKPENVVHVDGSRAQRRGLAATVKLVDFGNCIERRQLPLYEDEDAADESGGYDIQTLAYRAPEVAMGVSITPAMDMWSLGCVLVECATGKPLFGETVVNTDGSAHHSLTNSIELIDQIEWLLTGGVPLGKSRPSIYARARYYKYRTVGRKSPALGTSAAQHLPLRHRLDVSRPDAVSLSEWSEFQDFVEQLLDLNPVTRMSARSAFLHPFVQSVFPFQLIFAPQLSANSTRLREIDTAPSDEGEQMDGNEKQRRKNATHQHADTHSSGTKKKKRKRHVSSSLKHALELIPKAPPPSMKKEPKWI